MGKITTVAAPPAHAHVACDARKPACPGRRNHLAVELMLIAPCLQQRFLGEIFGALLAAD